MKRKKKKFDPGELVLNLFMLVIALTMLIPILNLLAKSLSDPSLVPRMKGVAKRIGSDPL